MTMLLLITQESLRHLGWERLLHPSYSPHLSPPDFDLFGKLKEPLRGQRFDDIEDVKSAANRVLRNLNSAGVLTGITKLPIDGTKLLCSNATILKVDIIVHCLYSFLIKYKPRARNFRMILVLSM